MAFSVYDLAIIRERRIFYYVRLVIELILTASSR